MFDTFIRLTTLALLISRAMYWHFSGLRAQKEKPGVEFATFRSMLGWVVSGLLEGIIYLQLVKLVVILPIRNGLVIVQAIGLLVVMLGVWICFVARKELGSNWSHAADYQIKKTHQLVTTGIYHYIRHPIYFGLALSWIGAEMVCGSFLFVSFLGVFVAFYIQGKREEKNFLTSRFGKEYKAYMKKTKMLIPWVL